LTISKEFSYNFHLINMTIQKKGTKLEIKWDAKNIRDDQRRPLTFCFPPSDNPNFVTVNLIILLIGNIFLHRRNLKSFKNSLTPTIKYNQQRYCVEQCAPLLQLYTSSSYIFLSIVLRFQDKQDVCSFYTLILCTYHHC
jgi:hypothetical protein